MINKDFYKIKDKYNDLDKSKAINDLSNFIKCKTISYIDQTKMDFSEFTKIHSYIIDNYPYINKYGKYNIINKGSIYYEIEGKDLNKPAIILMGHLDVVPPIEEDKWDYEPFSGEITEKYIYGRGSLDMKNIDCTILNSIEYSLSHFGKPDKTIYICFGHDEETLGKKGQWEIKNKLREKNVNIGMVIDEGGTYSKGTKYNISKDILEIQVGEKGYLDIKIDGTSEGGHSSNPGKSTALTNVCNAITKITSNPFESNLDDTLIKTINNIKPYIIDEEFKQLCDDVESNHDKIASYLDKKLNLGPYVKTTIAPTMISSDSKGANVLPKEVSAIINLRLSSFNKAKDVKEKIKDLLKDIDVKVTFLNEIDASQISSIDSNEYKLLTSLIKEHFNIDCIVPSISIGGTDCCFYTELTPNCYRFSPIINDEELAKTIHGVNEHVTIDSYINGIKFYIDLINKYCF